jgi:hypothetical protein
VRKPFVLHHDFKDSDTCRIACFSDLHIGHPRHQAELLAEDLKEAADLECHIMLLGDLNDLILHCDPRATPSQLGQEDALLNTAVRETTEVLRPYVDLIDMICVGNHETAVLKHRSYDFVLAVIQELQGYRTRENRIYHGGYRGFFRIQFLRGHWRASQTWYYDHGRGGGAPVTKGMIDLSRIMKDWEADVYWMGHKHHSISDDDAELRRLNAQGNIEVRRRLGFFTAGYANAIVEYDYNVMGYVLDYAEERFLANTACGNAIVRYVHGCRGNRDEVTRYLDKAVKIAG